MKRNTTVLALIMLTVGMISSCDSEDGASCPEDFSGELTALEQQLVGDWMLTSIISDTAMDMTDDGEENPGTDFFAQYEPCQKDAVYSFGADRTYTFLQSQDTEGCDNKLTLDGTWKLAAAQLSMVSGCSLQNNVIEFAPDGAAFSFSGDFSVRDVNGQVMPAKISFTYTAL